LAGVNHASGEVMLLFHVSLTTDFTDFTDFTDGGEDVVVG